MSIFSLHFVPQDPVLLPWIWLVHEFLCLQILGLCFVYGKEEFVWCVCYDHRDINKELEISPGAALSNQKEWPSTLNSPHQKEVCGLCWGAFSIEWKIICVQNSAMGQLSCWWNLWAWVCKRLWNGVQLGIERTSHEWGLKTQVKPKINKYEDKPHKKRKSKPHSQTKKIL